METIYIRIEKDAIELKVKTTKRGFKDSIARCQAMLADEVLK